MLSPEQPCVLNERIVKVGRNGSRLVLPTNILGGKMSKMVSKLAAFGPQFTVT